MGSTRKTILMLLLAFASASAAADWVWVGDTSDAGIYVDPGSVRRSDDVVKMGVLYELKRAVLSKTNGNRYASQILQSEYDCRDEKWRMLSFSWHSGSMGAGKMVEELTDSYKWESVPPGSGVAALWQFACARR